MGYYENKKSFVERALNCLVIGTNKYKDTSRVHHSITVNMW